MRNSLFYLCLFLMFFSCNQTKEQNPQYEVTYTSQIIHPTSKDYIWGESNHLQAVLNKMTQKGAIGGENVGYSALKQYTLLTDKQKSSFINTELFMATEDGTIDPDRNVRYKLYSEPIYKNFKEKTIFAYAKDEQIWETPTETFQWRVHWNEKMNLLGYEATKATANYFDGTEITAWFTEDIPIPDGPSLINGLPGLILKCRILNVNYEAKEIQKVSQKQNINFPKEKPTILSFKEWSKTSNHKTKF